MFLHQCTYDEVSNFDTSSSIVLVSLLPVSCFFASLALQFIHRQLYHRSLRMASWGHSRSNLGSPKVKVSTCLALLSENIMLSGFMFTCLLINGFMSYRFLYYRFHVLSVYSLPVSCHIGFFITGLMF